MDELYKLSREVVALVETHERFRATLKSVRSHTESAQACDELEIDFEIIGLPQHRRVQVRNIEPIIIHISAESIMPVVKVRDDFPIVSHLNIHEDNITKSICYVDVRYEEIRHKMSGRFLLMCIENWFLKTSMNELHRADQPIEPFFPYSNNVIIWDGRIEGQQLAKFALENREFGQLMYQNDDGFYYAILRLPVPQDYSNLIHNMPQTLNDLLCSFGNRDTLRQGLEFISAIIRNDNLYHKYFNQSKNKLLACKVIINIEIPKSRNASEEPEAYDRRTFVTQETLKDILEDYRFALMGSKIEESARVGGYGSNIAIRQFNVHFEHSRSLNKTLSTVGKDSGNERFTLVGVGALGSQILNNSLRTGYGKWTIIDNDYFWPHNIARHVLTSKEIGYRKAKVLADYAALIQSDSEIKAIPDDIFSGSECIYDALNCTDIILDVSASVAVGRHLALDIDAKARRLSYFLNRSGTATIMLLESVDRKARLDLLEMQYYRELVTEEKFANHMTLPGTMVYSGTCRSVTSRMSQDDVALSAALCSKALKTYLSDENGRIAIWTHEDDSVSKDTYFADSWTLYHFNDWIIEISDSLLEEIKKERTQFMPNETGGVLIGSFDMTRRRVYIVCQIKAPDDSIHAPDSFIRGCLDLPEKLQSIDKATLGNLIYIGEWHSHPSRSTQKSSDDILLHHAISEYNREHCAPSCMIIVGKDDFSIFVEE
jgi:proteasome lid subunit RPN8/RPN11